MAKRTRTPKEIVPLPSVDGMLQFKPVRSAVNFLISNKIPYVDKGWFMEVKEADVPINVRKSSKYHLLSDRERKRKGKQYVPIKQKVIVRIEPEQPQVFTRPPAVYSNPQWHKIYEL